MRALAHGPETDGDRVRACAGAPEVLETGASLGRLQHAIDGISPQSVFFAMSFVIAPVLSALAFFISSGWSNSRIEPSASKRRVVFEDFR